MNESYDYGEMHAQATARADLAERVARKVIVETLHDHDMLRQVVAALEEHFPAEQDACHACGSAWPCLRAWQCLQLLRGLPDPDDDPAAEPEHVPQVEFTMIQYHEDDP